MSSTNAPSPNAASASAPNAPGRICVGQFTGAHGVRGLVKLKSFTGDPGAVAAYGPLSDEAGMRRFAVSLTGSNKGVLLASVAGVSSREQAQALAGVRLYVDRSALPETGDEDEFYHADLIGLRAERADGTPFGTVKALYDFGGGDVLEVRTVAGATELLPFTKACVPVVDVRRGRLVVEPPEVVEARPEADGPEAGDHSAGAGDGEGVER